MAGPVPNGKPGVGQSYPTPGLPTTSVLPRGKRHSCQTMATDANGEDSQPQGGGRWGCRGSGRGPNTTHRTPGHSSTSQGLPSAGAPWDAAGLWELLLGTERAGWGDAPPPALESSYGERSSALLVCFCSWYSIDPQTLACTMCPLLLSHIPGL